MENQTAICVDHVTKLYKLYDKPSDRLKESLGLTRRKCYREHYALTDVSFAVGRGETIGIIGTNGAGKSTMLKIITGVLNPTSGSVRVNGRISALLELGAGFNMEYTGVENVYLNGAMMGFSDAEIDARLQDILDFADIGDFVNQPVKTYSSGMFVRLAFAVAINIDPEILIVDEALSVGDVFFQAKCYRKFEEFKEEGKTILFVSHDLNSISKYCDRVILLDHGKVRGSGSPKDMVDLYKQLLVHQDPEHSSQRSEVSGQEAVAGGQRSAAGGNASGGQSSVSGGKAAGGQDSAARGRSSVSGGKAAGGWSSVSGGKAAGGQDSASGGQSSVSGGKAAGGRGSASGRNASEGRKAADSGRKTADKAGTGGGRGIWSGEESPADSGDVSGVGAALSWSGVFERNPNTLEYGDRRAEMTGFMIFDAKGLPTNTIEKGASFTLKVRALFHEDVSDPIFAFTIKDMRGTEITGTNTMFERISVEPCRAGETAVVSYTQKADLQGGEYLISLGLTGYRNGEFVVYHRLYDVCSLVVVSSKNTVGFYDMNSVITVEKEPGTGKGEK